MACFGSVGEKQPVSLNFSGKAVVPPGPAGGAKHVKLEGRLLRGGTVLPPLLDGVIPEVGVAPGADTVLFGVAAGPATVLFGVFTSG